LYIIEWIVIIIIWAKEYQFANNFFNNLTKNTDKDKLEINF